MICVYRQIDKQINMMWNDQIRSLSIFMFLHTCHFFVVGIF